MNFDIGSKHSGFLRARTVGTILQTALSCSFGQELHEIRNEAEFRWMWGRGRVDGLSACQQFVVDRYWGKSLTLLWRLAWALSLPHIIFPASPPVSVFSTGLLLIGPPSPVLSNYLFHSVPRSHLCIFTAALLSSSYHLHFWGPVLDINAAEQTGCSPRCDA